MDTARSVRLLNVVLVISLILAACAPAPTAVPPTAAPAQTTAVPQRATPAATQAPSSAEVVLPELPTPEPLPPLPTTLLAVMWEGLDPWAAQAVQSAVDWLKTQGTYVTLEVLPTKDISNRINNGEVPDLLFGYFGSIHTDLTKQGALPLLTLTGDRADVWRTVVVTRQDSGIDSLTELRGRRLAGFQLAETLAALAAEGVAFNDIKWFPLSTEEGLDVLLAGNADAAVVSTWGLEDFYKRDLMALLDLKVIGYGLPIPTNYVIYAGPVLSNDERWTLAQSLIDLPVSKSGGMGFAWVDDQELNATAHILDLAMQWRDGQVGMDALRSALNLGEDSDQDGVTDWFDECPSTSETADNTVAILGRDGCPTLWNATGGGQMLHLLMPVTLSLDAELAKLALVAGQYGHSDLANAFEAAARAAASGQPEALVAALETVSSQASAGIEPLATLVANDPKEQDLFDWFHDKVTDHKNRARSFLSTWSMLNDIYKATSYAAKKGGINNWTRFAALSVHVRTISAKFPRLLNGVGGLVKTLQVVDKLLWFDQKANCVVKSYMEAYYLIGRRRDRDFQLAVDQRLRVNCGEHYALRAIWELVPFSWIGDAAFRLADDASVIATVKQATVELIQKVKEKTTDFAAWVKEKARDLKGWLMELARGIDVSTVNWGVKLYVTEDHIRLYREAMGFRDKHNIHDIVEDKVAGKLYIRQRENQDMPGDMIIDTRTKQLIFR